VARGGFARRFAGLLIAAGALACAVRAPESPPAPEGIGPVVARAEAAEAAGDHDAAIAAWREALERTPWNDRLRTRLAAAYGARAAAARAKGGSAPLERAERDLRAARELAPQDATVQRNLALVLGERAARSTDPRDASRLRAEAAALDAEAAASTAALGDEVERRLDVAHGLVARGQIEAGLLDLEPLWREQPGRADVGRLYAQTLLRQGVELEEQGSFERAAPAFERALEVLRAIGACAEKPCDDPDVRAAHHDRIVNWLNADRPDAARAALADAARDGLRFPELSAALGEAR
jgi:tetratricopeptide (TPR) repeat protein